MLKTSLIVPVYNEAYYLPLLIQSIRNSSVQPDEILFCDNKSTDNSVAVIKAACKGLPTTVITQHKKGILPTVQRLWKAASGDIILKVDADSILPMQWIENIVHRFERKPKLAACTGPVYASDGSPMQKGICNMGYSIGNIYYQNIKGYVLLYGPNSAFRKFVLNAINGYTWHENELDDQIISKKLHQFDYMTRWYKDVYMYHSTRRYTNRPIAYIETLLSLINPKYYNEKNTL